MTLPTTGFLTASMINLELQKSANAVFRLSNTDVRALANVASGSIKFSDLRGKTFEYVATIASNTTNVVIQNLFTPTQWSSTATKRVVINSGVVVGSSNSSIAALRTGTGNGGSLIAQNNGSIIGAGGTINGGTGGTALIAEIAMSLVNAGNIYGGGGGGGIGGIGGQGFFTTNNTVQEGPYTQGYISYTYGKQGDDNSPHSDMVLYWAGNVIASAHDASIPNPVSSGAYTYYYGTYNSADVYRTYVSVSTTYTPGGNGGNGGRGQGFDGANTNGSTGSAGGTNAGTGGTGGNGGIYGANGTNGSTGSSGNYSGGLGGGTGGLAGLALSNIANITLTNTGSILGRQA